jgi:hypothetical protein
MIADDPNKAPPTLSEAGQEEAWSPAAGGIEERRYCCGHADFLAAYYAPAERGETLALIVGRPS